MKHIFDLNSLFNKCSWNLGLKLKDIDTSLSRPRQQNRRIIVVQTPEYYDQDWFACFKQKRSEYIHEIITEYSRRNNTSFQQSYHIFKVNGKV